MERIHGTRVLYSSSILYDLNLQFVLGMILHESYFFHSIFECHMAESLDAEVI